MSNNLRITVGSHYFYINQRIFNICIQLIIIVSTGGTTSFFNTIDIPANIKVFYFVKSNGSIIVNSRCFFFFLVWRTFCNIFDFNILPCIYSSRQFEPLKGKCEFLFPVRSFAVHSLLGGKICFCDRWHLAINAVPFTAGICKIVRNNPSGRCAGNGSFSIWHKENTCGNSNIQIAVADVPDNMLCQIVNKRIMCISLINRCV